MDKIQAWDFIHKYIEGRSTAAEHEAFHEWLLNRPFSETEELLHEYSRLLEQKREYIPADPRVLERIEKYISVPDTIRRPGPGDFRIRTDSRIRTGLRVRRKFLYAAAAAVLALLIALPVLYRVLNNKAVELPAINSIPEVGAHIAPGGDKAVLTLADGSRILLDDASGGVLARQGKTRVLKLDNGELAYESGSSAAREGLAPTEELYNTIETPRGGQYQLTLSDGTKVWLNAASSLRFPASFNGTERTVYLTGEAYFEVTPSFEAKFEATPSPGTVSRQTASSRVSSGAVRKRPFYVRVNDMEVKVLGTHFNIMAYEDERQVQTTLLEGSVEISPVMQAGESAGSRPGQKPARPRPGQGGQSTRLYPGQRASLDKASETLEVKEVNVEEAIAWQKGYFQFSRADIYTIMRQVSRWYDIDVVYEGSLPQEQFVGKISRDEPLSKVLRIFKLSRIHFRMEDKTIIVMP